MLPDGLDEALGDGFAVRDGDGEVEEDGLGEEDGEGDGLADEGTAWHVVLAVVAWGAACALPRRPRERKLPLSKVTAAALACAKRIRIACLCCSSGLPCAVRHSEARADRMAGLAVSVCQATFAPPVLRFTALLPGRVSAARLGASSSDGTVFGPDRFRE